MHQPFKKRIQAVFRQICIWKAPGSNVCTGNLTILNKGFYSFP
jgi:hypothetical protein